MTPIERVSIRSQALSALGLDRNSSKEELRRAFRKKAFDTHPDRQEGSEQGFIEVTEAYEYLRGEASNFKPANAGSTPTRTVSRPSVQSTEVVFSNVEIHECLHYAGGEAGNIHVATRLYRRGRRLSYFVQASPAEGENTVVMPTGDLVDSRRVMPQSVTFDKDDLRSGSFMVNSEDLADKFPGAREVHIQFAWS